LRLLFTLAKEKKEGYRVTLQPGDYWLGDLLRQHRGAPDPVEIIQPDDPAILLFSGGTTGTPKAVLGTHRMLFISAVQLHTYAKTVLSDWTDRLTLFMPMFHVYGNMCLNTALLARWPMVIIPNPRDLHDVIATIRTARPAVLHGIPTLFISLLNHPLVKSGKADFTSIKICYSAAAPMLAETKTQFEKLTGGILLEAYSMTETILASVVCPVHGVYKPGSTGLPLPDVDVRIVDLADPSREMPPGEQGEIAVKAPQIMAGYWGHPEETQEILRDGWIYSGDIGYMDEDGYLFIKDRKKDLIKPAGFQVWPREVEEVIATHPAVAEVCVAGVPDPQLVEAVKAWVVLKPDAKLGVEELKEYCREKLTRYKVPRFVEFRPSLPKTLVGKVLRRALVSEEGTSSSISTPVE
jgi:long-chain acyl-CoA synthetase